MMFNSLSSLSAPFLIGTCLFGILTTAAPIDDATNTLERQSCRYDNDVFYRDWIIHIDNDDKYDKGGCGAGFLDNFRGRCGAITDWTCSYEGGTNIYMNFKTSVFCSNEDISSAIAAASYGNVANLPCTWILA